MDPILRLMPFSIFCQCHFVSKNRKMNSVALSEAQVHFLFCNLHDTMRVIFIPQKYFEYLKQFFSSQSNSSCLIDIINLINTIFCIYFSNQIMKTEKHKPSESQQLKVVAAICYSTEQRKNDHSPRRCCAVLYERWAINNLTWL